MPFKPGNHYAAIGGKKRAEKLTPERRREIATLGGKARFAQLEARYGKQGACDYLARLGAWGAEEASYGAMTEGAGAAIYNHYEIAF